MSVRHWMEAGQRQIAAFVVALAACASGEAPSAAPPAASMLGTSSQALSTPDGGAAVDASDATADAGAAAAVDAGAAAVADAAAAGDDGAATPSNGCCSTSSAPSCADEAVAACVCQGDPFCCSTEYDALCVTQAVSRCGQACDERPPVSACCTPSDVPGCTLPDVAACICEVDPFCCVFRFDQSCVNLGASRCNLSCGEAVP